MMAYAGKSSPWALIRKSARLCSMLSFISLQFVDGRPHGANSSSRAQCRVQWHPDLHHVQRSTAKQGTPYTYVVYSPVNLSRSLLRWSPDFEINLRRCREYLYPLSHIHICTTPNAFRVPSKNGRGNRSICLYSKTKIQKFWRRTAHCSIYSAVPVSAQVRLAKAPSPEIPS